MDRLLFAARLRDRDGIRITANPLGGGELIGNDAGDSKIGDVAGLNSAIVAAGPRGAGGTYAITHPDDDIPLGGTGREAINLQQGVTVDIETANHSPVGAALSISNVLFESSDWRFRHD